MSMRLLSTFLCLLASAIAGAAGAPAATSPFVVDGMALGGPFRATRDFQCKDSIQFTDVTWCVRKRYERSNRGGFISTTSILLTPDDAIGYVNREIEPAFFGATEIQNQIDRLTAKFGARARIMRPPQRAGLPNAVIAAWGRLELEQLDDNVVAKLATTASPRLGLLVDYLGDVKRSAELHLPIFRLSGGAGYLWSASADDSGRGHLRFLEVDASALAPGKLAKSASAISAAPTPPVPGPDKPTATHPKVASANPPAKDLAKSLKSEDRGVETERVVPESSVRPHTIAAPRPEPEKPTGSLGKAVSERVPAQSAPVPSEAANPAKKTNARLSADAERVAIETGARSATVPAQPQPEPRAVEHKPNSWTMSQGAMIGLAALALAAFALAMRIQRRETAETELAADRKTDLSARLGRAPNLANPRPAAAPAQGGASADAGLFATLKSYLSAACLLTVAVSIYMQSQNPAAIKNFLAHFRQAANNSMPTP